MVIDEFERCITKLEDTFRLKSENYFFTEKELHSYFYSLCLQNDNFQFKNLNLVHTEYPTPFKTSVLRKYPFIKISPIHSKAMRSHIDLILLNPNFIQWLKTNNKDIDVIKGLTNKYYPKYIKYFIETYVEFVNETKEPILIYAVEFKYLRNEYEGSKYPILSLKQDIEKLKKLQNFRLDFMKIRLPFVDKILSYVFIESNRESIYQKIISDQYFYRNSSLIKIVKR